MTANAKPLVAVRGLKKHYPIRKGVLRSEVGRIRAVDGIDLDLYPGETVGLVGESGCGKSTTALSILRLEEPTAGSITFDGQDVLSLSASEMRAYRRQAQLVLQDPGDAFNPRIPVGQSVGEPLRVHGMGDSQRRRAIVEDVLERVGLSASAADQYPHAFSGGEKQRLALARALVLNPDLIVADEPVSALDGRTKTTILSLLADIQQTYGIAILFISHDLDTVRHFCDRVAVMYLGKIVERGPVPDVLNNPSHPYTQLLKRSIPDLDPETALDQLGGTPLTDHLPEAASPPPGCRFHPRCPAIIQPQSVSMPPDEWRQVAAFYRRLSTLDPTESSPLQALTPAPTTISHTDEYDTDSLRDACSLPCEISDVTVETAMKSALEAILAGHVSEAQSILSDILESPCERTEPESYSVQADWDVSCFHYNGTNDGTALE